MAFSKDLEELIEASLADGVLTEKKRMVLHKKAKMEGVDSEELDIILDGRLAKKKQQENLSRTTSTQSSKIGNVLKCPSCGAPYIPGQGQCPECGHVFQNLDARKSSVLFAEGLAKANEKTNMWKRQLTGKDPAASFIRTFPIPSTKDDLIDFLTFLDSQRRSSSDENLTLQAAYNSKFKECVKRAKILFPQDSQMQQIIKNLDTFYMTAAKKLFVGYGVVLVVIIIICWLAS